MGTGQGTARSWFMLNSSQIMGSAEGCMGLRGARSGPSLGEGPKVQVSVYHVFCCRVLRGERWEWWTETWSSKAGPLGIGGAQTTQGFGLGGLTSPFTVLSSMGSPSMMATSVNGRESRLFRVDAVISDLHNFDSYIKARKRQGCVPGCWACLLQ